VGIQTIISQLLMIRKGSEIRRESRKPEEPNQQKDLWRRKEGYSADLHGNSFPPKDKDPHLHLSWLNCSHNN